MLKNYVSSIVLFLIVSKCFGNCELYSAGYHTIATYRKDDKDFNTKEALASFKIKNDYIEISTGGSDPQYDKNFSYSSFFNLKTIQVGSRTCKIEGEKELLLSNVSQDSTLKIPLCKQFNTEEFTGLKGEAFLSYKNNTLYLPTQIQAIPTVETDKLQIIIIEKNISEILKTKFFRGETQLVLAPDEYIVEKFDHQKFEKTDMFVTNVTAISNKKNQKLRIKFGLTFISFEGTSWYIADSSFIDPCESDEGAKGYFESKKAEQEAAPDRFIGHMINIKGGQIFGEDKYPRLIGLNDLPNLYLMDFAKKLIVIRNSDNSSNDYTNFGLQNKNPILNTKE